MIIGHMCKVVRQAAIQRRDIIARARETHAQVAVCSIKLEAMLVDILNILQSCPEEKPMVHEHHSPWQPLDMVSKVARVVTKEKGACTHSIPLLSQSFQHFKTLLYATTGEDEVIAYHQHPLALAGAESNVHELAPTVSQPRDIPRACNFVVGLDDSKDVPLLRKPFHCSIG